MTPEGGSVKMQVYLPQALVREVKHRAIDEETSLSRLVERALRDYMQHDGEAK